MSLDDMRKIDVRDIDPCSVVDHREVSVKTELSKVERMWDTIHQMGGNPYFIKVGKVILKMSYTDTDISINKRWEDYLRTI